MYSAYVHGEQLCVRLVARFLVDAGCIGTDVDPATADLLVTAGDVDPAWRAANPRAILVSLPAYASADAGMPSERGGAHGARDLRAVLRPERPRRTRSAP